MDQKESGKQNIPTVPRSVISVKTDGDAKLPKHVNKLEPNTKYKICKDEYVPPARKIASREGVVEWIDKCVLGDLRTMLLGIRERRYRASKLYRVRLFLRTVLLGIRERRDETQSPVLGGGNFLLAAGCCMALEYFGQVYGEGKNAMESVQKYVENFLKPIDDRYRKVWPILWRSFRNGIIHGSWPQTIRTEDSKNQIAIGADNSPDGDHLGPASDHEGKSFVISSYRFFCDIERSFNEGFRDWILHESDDEILERAAPRLLEIKSRNNEGKDAFDEILRMNAQAEENSYGTPPSEG